MSALSFLFWVILGTIFYTYVGYGLLLWLLRSFKKKKNPPLQKELPKVTLLIASYNEAAILEEKVQNTLLLEYPKEKLSVLIVTDGSTDNSGSILKKYPEVKVLHQPERFGKTAAINRAMQEVDSEIVIFSDANTTLNKTSIQGLVSHFSNEKVGAVAGEKKVAYESGVGSAEGWYWRYESFMKGLDASFYTVVGAAGELFAMRTSLFSPLQEDTILDDFVLSMKVCLQGFIIAYEPAAFATEAPSASLGDEKKRKIRIATGAFQSLKRLSFLQIFSKPLLAFQFVSRRWLRWVICPVGLPLLFIINILLAYYSIHSIYAWLFIPHLFFYLFALVGWVFMKRDKVIAVATIPFYFSFMNYCIVAGWIRFLQGKETVLWAKAERKDSHSSK
ncbi:MAG: glycosyl transferase [Flaviaesturariibacter sp.]|nr:glycosyl transferase [Flaviaesturariibacter sp.]